MAGAGRGFRKVELILLACAERDGHWNCVYCGTALAGLDATEGTVEYPARWYDVCPDGSHCSSPCWHASFMVAAPGYEWPVSDHVMPRVRGGGDELANRANACRRCNSVKGSKLLSELSPDWSRR